jgi:hypothetical protein
VPGIRIDTLSFVVFLFIQIFSRCRAMLSNPPLSYGPDLGAASADPVETENYEALLNLGNLFNNKNQLRECGGRAATDIAAAMNHLSFPPGVLCRRHSVQTDHSSRANQ